MSMVHLPARRDARGYTCWWVVSCIILVLGTASVRSEVTFNPSEETGISVSLGTGRIGRFRVAYDNEAACIDTVVYVGVGTAMRVTNYSELSRKIVELSPTTAVVAADHRPRFFLKHAYFGSFPRIRLARLANHVHDSLADYVPRICEDTEADDFPRMVLGGHSASGITVIEAIQHPEILTFQPAGFLALEVFLQRIPGFTSAVYSNFDLTGIPSVVWGWSENTCMVIQELGSKLAYRMADPIQRVLYQISTDQTRTGHCDFTDNGCGDAVCGLSPRAGPVLEAAAESVHLLLQALDDTMTLFTRENLQLTPPDDDVVINMFFGTDDVP